MNAKAVSPQYYCDVIPGYCGVIPVRWIVSISAVALQFTAWVVLRKNVAGVD